MSILTTSLSLLSLSSPSVRYMFDKAQGDWVELWGGGDGESRLDFDAYERKRHDTETTETTSVYQ